MGLCGTDVGVVHGYVAAKFPVTLGHEFAGTIAQLGSPTLCGFKEGEHVRASGGWGCGACEAGKQGNEPLCRNRASLRRDFLECVKDTADI